jgi:peptide/nickel transport system substrate-binding protein
MDSETVRFRLDAPNNFPHIVSSDNYNAIILPRNYSGNWQNTFIGTGPWKLPRRH